MSNEFLFRWGQDPIGTFRNCGRVRGNDVITLKAKPKGIYMETRSAEEIEESTERLLQDLKAVVRDGEDLLRAGAQNLSEKGLAARERLAAALEVAKETSRRLQDRAVASAKATDRLIRENPYQSIGIAFGVGMLLGILANRR